MKVGTKHYSAKEDQTILIQLRSVDKFNHRQVMERCQLVCDNHLPHRSAYGVRARWFKLIGKIQREPKYTPPIASLDDLLLELSDSTRARINITLPGPRPLPREKVSGNGT